MFFTARNISAAYSHLQITAINGPNTVSESKVRKWIREFKIDLTNKNDGEHSVITAPSDNLNFKKLGSWKVLRLLTAD